MYILSCLCIVKCRHFGPGMIKEVHDGLRHETGENITRAWRRSSTSSFKKQKHFHDAARHESGMAGMDVMSDLCRGYNPTGTVYQMYKCHDAARNET